jgi:hypothetical protein
MKAASQWRQRGDVRLCENRVSVRAGYMTNAMAQMNAHSDFETLTVIPSVA